MRWCDIDFNPTDRKLRQFAILWLVFFGGWAIWNMITPNELSAIVCSAIAIIGCTIGLIRPGLIRPIYSAWMTAAFPIGWLVSHFLLALLFFGLFTPLAWIMKLFGRDHLSLRRQPNRATYWIPKPVPVDVRRYYRPY